MSLKAELEAWAAALKAYDEDDYDKSLQLFSSIADSSKILCNIGLIYATLGEHEAAVEQFNAATQLDQYLAVAYFQCGVSNFLLSRYDLALKDFDEALLYLRGNQAINYEQLGLKFKLFSAEVLFNKGLAQIYMGQVQQGLADMEAARREKATDEHNVIDDAIADRGEGYTVFSIPVGVLYRPSENKLKNAKAKDYMGKAKLVATSDASEAYTTFTGVTRLKQGISPSGVYLDDGPSSALSRSATVANPPVSRSDDMAVSALQRSKTTLDVPSDARDRIRAAAGTPGLARSITSAGSSFGPGPTRGLSVRRAQNAPPTLPAIPAAASPSKAASQDFYGDYIDSYAEDGAPPPPRKAAAAASPVVTPPADRVGAWARNNANPAAGTGAMQRSRSVAPSSYAPSAYSAGGTPRRRLTRRNTGRAPSSRAMSMYEEEEEGYVSGDYEDAPFEMVKIRVKLHYQDDVRGMALTPDVPFEEFMARVTAKFEKPRDGLGLKFKDEDGGKVTLRDEMDYELAIETARESAKGKPEGRLEIWCADR